MSLVSQAWFTTKEDKDTLTNKGTNTVVRETRGLKLTSRREELFGNLKLILSNRWKMSEMLNKGIKTKFEFLFSCLGHKWKQGMWSKEEIDILINNIDRYVKVLELQPPLLREIVRLL